jgi:hypothetical protein
MAALTIGLANLALVGAGIDISLERSAISTDGAIISWHNRRERLWKAHDLWKKMQAEREGKASHSGQIVLAGPSAPPGEPLRGFSLMATYLAKRQKTNS